MEKPYRHKKIGDRTLAPETQMMGYGYDPALSEGSVKVPIFQTSTFVFRTAEEGKAFFQLAYGLRDLGPNEEAGLIYSRINNPDLQILEDRLTLWDGAEASLVFSAAWPPSPRRCSHSCGPATMLVHNEPVYGGTEHLVENVLPEFGIEREVVRRPSPARRRWSRRWRRRLPAAASGVIFVETPANPTNDLVDIARVRRGGAEVRRRPTAAGRSWSSTTRSSGRCGSSRSRAAPTWSSTRSRSTSAATATWSRAAASAAESLIGPGEGHAQRAGHDLRPAHRAGSCCAAWRP